MFQARVLVQAAGFDIVREPFRTRFLPALAQHSITAVLDVGANRGQFGHELRRGHFDGRIVSVEPLSEAFAALSAAAARDSNWQVEQAAVAEQPGTLTVNVSQNSVSSSVLLDAGAQCQGARRRRTPCRHRRGPRDHCGRAGDAT